MILVSFASLLFIDFNPPCFSYDKDHFPHESNACLRMYLIFDNAARRRNSETVNCWALLSARTSSDMVGLNRIEWTTVLVALGMFCFIAVW